MAAPLPPDEDARLAALHQLGILDTPTEADYDDLTRLAAAICDTPIALVSIVDRDRQWFKSRVGLDSEQTPRESAFCAHTILQTEPLIVNDALADERFMRNPLVTSEPFIRFYAGAPLIAPSGHALGSICVIDRLPRWLTGRQIEALSALSRQASRLMELRASKSALAMALEKVRVFERRST